MNESFEAMDDPNPTIGTPESRLATTIRWALVPVAGWLGWAAAVSAAFAMESVATAMCPDELMISGMCTARWYELAVESITCAGAAIAAALVVLLCTIMAPRRKRTVARLTFIVGAIVALALAIASKQLYPFVAALVSGALVWRIIDGRLASRPIESI